MSKNAKSHKLESSKSHRPGDDLGQMHDSPAVWRGGRDHGARAQFSRSRHALPTDWPCVMSQTLVSLPGLKDGVLLSQTLRSGRDIKC